MSENFIDFVITARPSWARIKNLVSEFILLEGLHSANVTLVGPAVSHRYGNIIESIPTGVTFDQISSLQESDGFSAIANSALNGGLALTSKWEAKRPKAVVVVADRTETLGVAATSSLMQIPLIHLQGGEVSGSIDDKVRDVNSKLADLHLTTNESTRQRLISMGEKTEDIFVVGCPSIDLVEKVIKTKDRFLLAEILNYGVGGEIKDGDDFGLIMFHPDTLHENENAKWVESIIQIVASSNLKWLWFWPNPDHGTQAISAKIRKSRELGLFNNVRFIINMEPEEFIYLAIKSRLLLGNSSFGIREASYIGLPVVNIGKRQLGRQVAENVQTLFDPEDLTAFNRAINASLKASRFPKSLLYGDGKAGIRAAEILSGWDPRLKN